MCNSMSRCQEGGGAGHRMGGRGAGVGRWALLGKLANDANEGSILIL